MGRALLSSVEPVIYTLCRDDHLLDGPRGLHRSGPELPGDDGVQLYLGAGLQCAAPDSVPISGPRRGAAAAQRRAGALRDFTRRR